MRLSRKVATMPRQQINTPARRTVSAMYDLPDPAIEIGERVRIIGSAEVGTLIALPKEIGGVSTEPCASITYADGQIGETVPLRLVVRPEDSDPTPNGHAEHWTRDGDRLHHGEHWEDTPTVFIGWDKNNSNDGLPHSGHVAVTMQVDADEVLRAADQIRRNRENVLAGAGVIEIEQFPFQAIGLTRPELQMLVRTARRARDEVYGGDE